MCGIYGRVLRANPPDSGGAVERRAARRAQRQIRHRGPDASGLVQLNGATLAHTRLRIIDLTDNAAQPMTNEDGSVAVTFNGEIYNFKELRSELAGRGHIFRSESDTETIVHGYEEWGTDVVSKLDGMFAFGLWDAPRRLLLLARDRPGKKPLFYHVSSGGDVTFGSEIKALGASGIPLEPDRRGVLDFLTYGYVPAPRTLYRDVFQLPPASALEVDGSGRQRAWNFWKIGFDCPAENRRMSTGEAAGRVRHLTEQAVRRRLISDVPLGAFLSGGIDSSIVVGIMSRLNGPGVKTFSIGFAGDPRYDETRFARIAARAFGTDHTEFVLEPQSFELVEHLVWLHDGPFGDSSAIPTYMVAKLTREHVTVALTGDGGDEVFAGYLRLYAAPLAELVPSPLRWMLGSAAGLVPSPSAVARFLPSELVARVFHQRTLFARAVRFMEAVGLPLSERILKWQNIFAFRLNEMLRPEVFREVMPDDPFEFQHALFAGTEGQTPLARVLDHNWNAYLPYDLQVKMDRCSMAHALEARSPFLDTDLVEGVAQLPDRMKLRRGITKYILKYAFKDLLPPEILGRAKMGFGVPLGQWFRTDLREYLADHLVSPGSRIHEYLRSESVNVLFREHTDGLSDWGHQLWSLLTMEVWLRQLAGVVPAAADA